MNQNQNQNISSKYTFIKDILILCVILFPYFLIFLGNHGLLETDEGRYNEIAWGMFKNKEYIIPKMNGVIFFDKPILFYWLQIISFKIFGFSEFAARFFPAITGIISCFGLYLFGTKLYSRKTGFIAAFILATMPYWFCLSHYSNMDIEVASWISLSLLSFITGINNYNKKLVILSYIFASLAFLTKGLIAIAFPVIIIGLWVIIDKKWNLIKHMKIVTGLILFFIISSPWFITVQINNPEFLHYFFIDQEIDRFVSTKMNERQAWFFYIFVIIAGSLPWVFFIFQYLINSFNKIINNHNKEKSTTIFLIVWVVAILIFFSIPKSKPIGYIAPVFPSIALLIAVFLSKIKNTYWSYKSFKFSIYLLILYFFIISGTFISVVALNLSPKNNIAYINFITQASIMIITGFLLICGYIKKNINFIISVLIISTAAFNINLLNTIPKFPINSVKFFAESLKQHIKENTTIVAYNIYPRGLPLYLNKKIIVVDNWSTKNKASDGYFQIFSFALENNPKDHRWIINNNKFINIWKNTKHKIIVIIDSHNSKNLFEKLQSIRKNACIIEQNKWLTAIKSYC